MAKEEEPSTKPTSPSRLSVPKEYVWNAKCTCNTWKPTGPKRPRQVSKQVKRGYYDFPPQEVIAARIVATQISGPSKSKLYYFLGLLFP